MAASEDADLGTHLGQVGVARRRPVGDQPHDLLVLLRDAGSRTTDPPAPISPSPFRADAPAAQSASSVSRALRACFSGGRNRIGAHVVQPVGHLDHQHPRVAGHRDDHLADRSRPRRRVPEGHLVQLGHPVDEVADLGCRTRRSAPPACSRCPPRCRAAAPPPAWWCPCRARPGCWPPPADG